MVCKVEEGNGVEAEEDRPFAVVDLISSLGSDSVLENGPSEDKALRITSGGTSLAVQWLGLCVSTAGDTDLIPVQGTKIPEAAQHTPQKKNYHW